MKVITTSNDGLFEEVLLTYCDARVVEPRGGLEGLELLSGDVELLYDEVDLSAPGRFVHRVFAWPTGLYAIEFTQLKLQRFPATSTVFHALMERSASDESNRALQHAWLDCKPSLVKAAALGNHAEIVALLRDGVSPNQADEGGWSALHAAALGSHLEVCKELVEAGAVIDTVDAEGVTPLFGALGRGDGRVIEYLHEHGADIFGRREDAGASALHHAVMWSNVATAQVILAAGVSVDARDVDGYTPLMIAAETDDDPAMVMLLLTRGADPLLRSPDEPHTETSGKRPSELARRAGRLTTAAILERAESASHP